MCKLNKWLYSFICYYTTNGYARYYMLIFHFFNIKFFYMYHVQDFNVSKY